MIKKSFAAVLAALCTVTSASALPVATGSAEDAYTMNVSVKLDGTKKEISPYIYGVNEYDSSSISRTSQGQQCQTGRQPLHRLQLGDKLVQRRRGLDKQQR